jgi:hypothetical protein
LERVKGIELSSSARKAVVIQNRINLWYLEVQQSEATTIEFRALTQASGTRLAARIARVETQARARKPTTRRSFGAAPPRVG